MTSKPRIAIALTAIFSLAFFSLFATAFAPTTHAQDDTETAATVRFVHVYSGGGPVDIYVDDQLLVNQLAFGTATEYASLNPGDHHIQVTATGTQPSDALIDKTLSFDNGSAYNVVIGGVEDDLDARSYEVNLDDVGVGDARIRFIPASPGAAGINIALTAPNGEDQAANDDDVDVTDDDIVAPGGLGTFNGVTDVTDYQEVPAGTYGMVVTNADEDVTNAQSQVNLPDIDLASGHVYDIVVIGEISANNLTLLPLITTVGDPCSKILGVGEYSDACVRFVNVSPSAGPVDVYIDGTRVVAGIAYGSATEFTTVSDTDHQVQVVQEGKSVDDDALYDDEIGFGAGQAYEVSVLGTYDADNADNSDLDVRRDEIDLTPLPPGQTRVQFIQAVEDADSVDIAIGGGEEIASDMDYNDVTKYVVMDAGSYELTVTNDEDNVLVDASSQQFNEGTTYDAYVIGRLDDPSSLKLLILDAPTMVRTGAQGTPLPVEEETETGVTPVGETQPTVVSGEEMTPTTVGAAPVTPVLTEEPTSTP